MDTLKKILPVVVVAIAIWYFWDGCNGTGCNGHKAATEAEVNTSGGVASEAKPAEEVKKATETVVEEVEEASETATDAVEKTGVTKLAKIQEVEAKWFESKTKGMFILYKKDGKAMIRKSSKDGAVDVQITEDKEVVGKRRLTHNSSDIIGDYMEIQANGSVKFCKADGTSLSIGKEIK